MTYRRHNGFAAAAVIAMAAFAAPAAAVNTVSFNFSRAAFPTPGPTFANTPSVSRTSNGVSVVATALNFLVAPGSLISLSQFTAGTRLIQQTVPGIGVAGGASSPQIDTNNASQREAILLSADTGFVINGLRLSYIDANDTLALFGVNADNSLVRLGFSDRVINGFGGAATFTNNGANNGTTTLAFTPAGGRFDRYIFTTAVGGDVLFGGDLGQGYRIDRVSGYVPEPGTWAMLILGFGLVGISARRRRGTVSVLA